MRKSYTGKFKHALAGHTGNVESVVFSPDGTMLASGSRDGTIRLWDVTTGQHKYTLTEHASGVLSVVFSPDGTMLASGSYDDTIRLWDALTGNQKLMLTGHTNYVDNVVFSPDGRTLVSRSEDGTILLWELTPTANANTIVSLSPSPVQSPAKGKQLTLLLNITGGENVAGYQTTVEFDSSALHYISSANGDYLSEDAFFIPPIVKRNTVVLAATSLAGKSSGVGTLATLTFEIIATKASKVRLSEVLLTDDAGGSSRPQVEAGEIVESFTLTGDVNSDGQINIQDLVLVASNFGRIGENVADINNDGVVNIVDLTLVAGVIGNAATAPSVWKRDRDLAPTRDQVEQWLREAQQINLADPAFQRGILILEQLLVVLTPKETALLPNYPNPFNPETWIPYQLAESADVSISIYAADGRLVQTLDLGHQSVGIYESRGRAAYWDGRNALGESMASGVYLYTLTVNDFIATRKMLIRK